METLGQARYSEGQRMEVRALVNLASEIIAYYWPMRTFIHHNILHGMEDLDFHDAVEQGRRFLGGRPYLPNEQFRHYFRMGRIRPEHVDAALQPIVKDKSVSLGGCRITHLDVLRAHLLDGITVPPVGLATPGSESEPDQAVVGLLAGRLQSELEPMGPKDEMRAVVHDDGLALGHDVSLGAWCDATLGTRISEQINWELIKWCGAFFDEGHATWPMPMRERTLFDAWKTLAQEDLSGGFLGISNWRRKLAHLPARPEDGLLHSLGVLGVPKAAWTEYLSLHLGALPGWAGFIKWRSEEVAYEWQHAYPASLVKYLAIRLWYEQELVAKACGEELGVAGDYGDILAFMRERPHEYFLRRERVAGRLPSRDAREVDRLRFRWPKPDAKRETEAWESLAERYLADSSDRHPKRARLAAARRLVALAEALGVGAETLRDAAPVDLRTLLDWLDGFPETQHGPVWLEAYESGYRQGLLDQIEANRGSGEEGVSDRRDDAETGPRAQAVFCIDVRSEGFRRHLEDVGGYETLGFAGFFAIPVRFRAFGAEAETDQCPVLVKPKHVVREIPRAYGAEEAEKHLAGLELTKVGHSLLHDLKENVITPYVMVEAVGWFFSLPFFGKTLFPVGYHKAVAWLRGLFAPSPATTMTVDKLTKEHAHVSVAVEQRVTIQRALRERLGRHRPRISSELVEALRLRALEENGAGGPLPSAQIRQVRLSAEDIDAFVVELRTRYEVSPRGARAQLERITKAGFTLEEQATLVETNLRLMGLTERFARLVLLCGHGSTSENNPFESALDCGACGGNHGMPNARVMTIMTNRPQIRERLAQHGLHIPPDTHFIAGQVDTTTDEVRLFDLEDVPHTHRTNLAQLMADLEEAGGQNSRERCGRLPGAKAGLSPLDAARHVRRRSLDWSQVRPEWGLSRNAAFIIGRRSLTKGLDLEGRTFLHSYDYRGDPTGKFLQVILTAPGVVVQWIAMEHYFSTVDPEVYGAGSKMYHNVAGRIGVMFGTHSDLRVGLPWQTVMDGERPYHEPMRPLYIVEAPRERITVLIQKNNILQRFFDGRWVHLVALEPEEGALYRYLPKHGWVVVHEPARQGS